MKEKKEGRGTPFCICDEKCMLSGEQFRGQRRLLKVIFSASFNQRNSAAVFVAISSPHSLPIRVFVFLSKIVRDIVITYILHTHIRDTTCHM